MKIYKTGALPPILRNRLKLVAKPTTADVLAYAERCGATKAEKFNTTNRRMTVSYTWDEDAVEKLFKIFGT